MKNILFSSLLALLILGGATQLSAQDTPWYQNVDMHGYVSSSFNYNMNKPHSGMNAFRIFDQTHNTFNFDVFQLRLQHDAEKAGDAGFRFDLITGALPQYTASSGLFGGQNIDVLQAYATYIVPLGDGLTIDAGKFLTHMGYELIEGYDGYNDNMSRSFCFGYAIPFAHTGVRASYGFSDMVSAMVMVANGWDNAVENNKNKTVGAQLALTPNDDIFFAVNGIYGAEGDSDNSNNTSVIDIVGTWSITDMISLGVNVDLGSMDAPALEDESASWTGFAGYLRFDLADKFAIALRGEQFDDADGMRTGVKQKLTEFTITPEYRPTDNFVFRMDFRMDSSDQNVFEDGEEMTDSQTTIGFNVIYLF
ncbi:porin [bacterium]|nr:porin [bacterium]